MALGYADEVKRQLTRAQTERRERRRQRMLGAGKEEKVALHAAMKAAHEKRKKPAPIVDHSDRKIKTRAELAREAGRRAAARSAGTLPVYPIHKTLKRTSKETAPVVSKTVEPVVKKVKPVVEIVPTGETAADKAKRIREAATAKRIAARKAEEEERKRAAREKTNADIEASEVSDYKKGILKRNAARAAESEAVIARRIATEEKIKKGIKGAGKTIKKWWTKSSELTKERRARLKQWNKLDAAAKAQYGGNFENFIKKNRVAQKAKGGVIRQPVAQNRRLAKGGIVKKSATKRTSRKKSIDGIARRGHTRAPHK